MLRNELRAFLSLNGIRLNTNLGQHFLVDEKVLQAIVDAAKLQKTDHLIEIGPGVGVLTRELLHHVQKVTAIEVDERMVPLLRTFTTYDPKLTIIHGNALHVDLPKEPYKIVANIPYHITSPLLRHAFLESEQRPTSLTLLIQREVAEKICDPQNAGMLTILVHLFGEPHVVCHVPPESFLPPPNVDSSVLHIECYPQPRAKPAILEEIFRLTKIAFGQKRKMLRKTLGALPEGECLQQLQIDPTRRPQTLSIDEWIVLAEKTLAFRGQAEQ